MVTCGCVRRKLPVTRGAPPWSCRTGASASAAACRLRARQVLVSKLEKKGKKKDTFRNINSSYQKVLSGIAAEKE